MAAAEKSLVSSKAGAAAAAAGSEAEKQREEMRKALAKRLKALVAWRADEKDEDADLSKKE